MGTLFNQIPRYQAANIPSDGDAIRGVLATVEDLQKNHALTFERALAVVAEARKERHARFLQNDLDAKDEQLAGFGELLREHNEIFGGLAEAVLEVKDALEDIRAVMEPSEED